MRKINSLLIFAITAAIALATHANDNISYSQNAITIRGDSNSLAAEIFSLMMKNPATISNDIVYFMEAKFEGIHGEGPSARGNFGQTEFSIRMPLHYIPGITNTYVEFQTNVGTEIMTNDKLIVLPLFHLLQSSGATIENTPASAQDVPQGNYVTAKNQNGRLNCTVFITTEGKENSHICFIKTAPRKS